MTREGLPHAFGSRHLESRTGWPIKWEGATEDQASQVARELHASMVAAGVEEMFTVARAGVFVTVTRDDTVDLRWSDRQTFYPTYQTEDHTYALNDQFNFTTEEGTS